jgi:hypothetical protein
MTVFSLVASRARDLRVQAFLERPDSRWPYVPKTGCGFSQPTDGDADDAFYFLVRAAAQFRTTVIGPALFGTVDEIRNRCPSGANQSFLINSVGPFDYRCLNCLAELPAPKQSPKSGARKTKGRVP